MEVFDVAVIGAGMIGSSAAKYVADDVETCVLIGPDRPREGISGAWFDEARITRKLDKNPTWRNLASESIDRYRDIEAASGINFYHEVGFLRIGGEGVEPEEEQTVDFVPVEHFQPLHWPSQQCKAVLQPREAGYINPRKLVQAQQKLAQMKNCTLLDAIVASVLKQGDIFSLSLQGHDSVEMVKAKRVILAPGAYVNIQPLMKGLLEEKGDKRGDLEPDLTLTTQTVAYLEVSETEAARLKKMPTLVTNYSYKKLDGTYILPPVVYPDGKYYLKLGHHDFFEAVLQRPEQMEAWYQKGTGDLEAVENLASFIIDHLIPDIQVLSVSGGCCVTAKTPGKKAPFVEEVIPGFVLAAGGCGYAAKSCDEIGRIAAKLCTTAKWTNASIPQDEMAIRWRKTLQANQP